MQYLALTFNPLNTSIQAGDLVFYIPSANIGSGGGFDFSANPPLLFGVVVEIVGNTITIEYDDIGNPNPPPVSGDYIMFAKDKTVNTSDLKGYYLEAEFFNNSKEKVELFAVGSEVVESSK